MTTAFPEQVRSRQLKALGITLGLHALLLLGFWVVKYAAPVPVAPPAEELGMEVNLGSSVDGFGTEQPEIMGDPAPEAAPSEPVAAAASAEAPSPVEPITASPSEDPDAGEIASRKENPKPTPPRPTPARPAAITPAKPTVATTTTPNRKPTTTTSSSAATAGTNTQQRPKVLFPGSTGTGGNGAARNRAGAGEGNTFGSGDRGVPGGTPGASNYEGSAGRGAGGVNHTLTGRRIIAPRLEGNFRNGGTVKMRITVNRGGNIINSSVISGSGELVALAKEKLQQVRFSAAPEGPVEQFGTVTFVFKTNQ